MQKLIMCVSGTALVLLGAQVLAQTEASSNSGLELEEIVVTATKRETDLQKTSIAIAVTSGAQLRQEGKRRIDEIMQGTAGVQFETNNFGANVFMRGLGRSEGGGENAVATMIDGAYQSRSEVLSNGTLDVAQVEVARGPQSTNLGASSLAGAVSLVSNKPQFEYQSSASIEAGNYSLFNTEGMVNFPVADNQAIRAAISTSKRNGYVSSGAGGNDNVNARVRYRWQPTDNLDMTFSINHQQSFVLGRSDTVAYSGYYQLVNYPASCTSTYDACVGYPPLVGHVATSTTYLQRSNPWNDGYPEFGWSDTPYRRNTINNYAADISWNLGFATLSFTPQVQSIKASTTEVPTAQTRILKETVPESSKQAELRLTSNGQSKLQWLGGLSYYYRNDPTDGTSLYYPGASTGMGPTAYTCPTTANGYCIVPGDSMGGITPTNSLKTLAGYGQATYSILDTLRAVTGLRYEKDTKDYITNAVSVGSTGAITIAAPAAYTGDWHGTTYRAGFEYDVLQNAMLYLTRSTGFQPGTLGAGMGTNSVAQTIDQWSLGLKARWFDSRLQTNVEVFDSVYHNRPLQGTPSAYTLASVNGVADGNTTTQQALCTSNGPGVAAIMVSPGLTCVTRIGSSPNIDKYTTRGVDLDFSWLPTANDRIDVTVEYLKAKEGAIQMGVAYDANAILTAAGITSPTTQQTTAAQALANNLAAVVNSYDGLVPQNSPVWSINATAQHRFALASGSSITPKINMINKSKYWALGGGPGADVANPGLAYQYAYTKWDAYLTWDNGDGKWQVSTYMKNVRNTPVQVNYGSGVPATVQLEAPRTFGLILNANF